MRHIFSLVAGAVLFCASASAYPVIDFASFAGGKIQFVGDGTFQFNPQSTGGRSIILTSANDFFTPTEQDDLLGLRGNIDGTFTIVNPLPGPSSPVTGSGAFRIYEGATNTFTADLSIVDIRQENALGGANTLAAVNLSNFQYSGSLTALQKLAGYPAGVLTATFQFTVPTTLYDLATKPSSTSFSGSLQAVPEPSHYGIALSGIVGMTLYFSRRRKSQR